MEPLCDTVPQMEKLADLSHKTFDVRARTTDKVNDLEDVNEQISEYEVELADIKNWMEKTRAHLTMRDDTLTLKDQLNMQEVCFGLTYLKPLIDFTRHKSCYGKFRLSCVGIIFKYLLNLVPKVALKYQKSYTCTMGTK